MESSMESSSELTCIIISIMLSFIFITYLTIKVKWLKEDSASRLKRLEERMEAKYERIHDDITAIREGCQ